MRDISFIKPKSLDLQFKKYIFICFNLLLFVTPFLFTWSNEELFEFIKMLFVYAMTIVITALWVGRVIVRKNLVFRKTKLDIPLLILLASQILATIFSIHPYTSVFGYYTRFHGGLLSTVSYALLYWAFVSNLSKKSIKPLLMTLLATGGLVSLYAIPEHFGHSLSCQLIHGHFDVSCWVQDVQNRVFASFGQPNWLAAFLITLIPLNIAFYLITKSKKESRLSEWLALLNSSLMMTALLFTKSRSGFLGLIAGLIILAFLFLFIQSDATCSIESVKKTFKKITRERKKFFNSVSLILLSLMIPLAVFGSPYTPSISQLVKKTKISQETVGKPTAKTIDPNISGTDSGDIRKIVWKGAVRVWKRYPLFGSGVETFAYSYYQDRPIEHNFVSEWDFLYNKAHNEFLNYLATTGIVGLTAYCVFLGSIFYMGISFGKQKSNKKKMEEKLLTIAILAGVGALTFSNFLGFSTVVVTLLLFILPGFLVVFIEKDVPIKQTEPSKKLKLINTLSLVFTGLIAIHCLFGVFKIWKADKLFTQSKSLIDLNEYQDGILKLQTAIQLAPKEALFYDELANSYSDIALQFEHISEASAAAEFSDLAIKASDKALKLNSRHLNFYKTRVNIYTRLASINPDYLNQASETLNSARELAPTNPKLVYQLALIKLTQNNLEESISLLELALEMKPNYHQARYKLAELYLTNKQYSLAKNHYQFILNQVPSDTNVKEKIEAIEASISAEKK